MLPPGRTAAAAAVAVRRVRCIGCCSLESWSRRCRREALVVRLAVAAQRRSSGRSVSLRAVLHAGPRVAMQGESRHHKGEEGSLLVLHLQRGRGAGVVRGEVVAASGAALEATEADLCGQLSFVDDDAVVVFGIAAGGSYRPCGVAPEFAGYRHCGVAPESAVLCMYDRGADAKGWASVVAQEARWGTWTRRPWKFSSRAWRCFLRNVEVDQQRQQAAVQFRVGRCVLVHACFALGGSRLDASLPELAHRRVPRRGGHSARSAGFLHTFCRQQARGQAASPAAGELCAGDAPVSGATAHRSGGRQQSDGRAFGRRCRP